MKTTATLPHEAMNKAAGDTSGKQTLNPLQLKSDPTALTSSVLQNPLSGNAAGQNPLQAFGKNHTATNPPLQRQANNTGLPDRLKSGVEALSGYHLDDVQVHYHSAKPAQLNAYAFAQGTDIHVAPGQEKYLPHEAWHVVQQKQGRVQTTRQLKGGVNVNDEQNLEREADEMGERAMSIRLTENDNCENSDFSRKDDSPAEPGDSKSCWV